MRSVYVVVLLVIVLTCDLTEAAPSRIRRQNVNQIRDCLRTCPSTSQYNPVCGSDNNTYDNEGKLNCAKDCGSTGLRVLFMGTCAPL